MSKNGSNQGSKKAKLDMDTKCQEPSCFAWTHENKLINFCKYIYFRNINFGLNILNYDLMFYTTFNLVQALNVSIT